MKSRLLFVLGLGIASASCASGSPVNGDPRLSDDATPEQRKAFEALEANTGQSFHWVQDARFKTPKHLGGSRTGKPLLGLVDPATTTLSLLREHRALFKMREPSNELTLERTEVDALGMTHVRFQQVTHGVPVVGAELAAHYDERGRIAAIQANYVPGLDEVDVAPKLAPETALALAKAGVLSRSPTLGDEDLETDDGKLVVFAHGDAPARLSWEHTLRVNSAEAPALWIVTVDAKTGEVIDMLDNLQSAKASAPGVLGETRTFEVSPTENGYVMTATTSGVSIQTLTAKNQSVPVGDPVTSTTLTEWDRVPAGAGSAVDAHVFAEVVRDYYYVKHHRNGIDGVGGPMLSTVHLGKDLENAYWNGRGMTYGDGGEKMRAFSAAIDLVGHEFTHGVTERTSALQYRDQSGALNEAVSDIMGAFVEHYISPDDTKNWLVGEVITKAKVALRDMKDPPSLKHPAAMSQFVNTTQDNGGVHSNSGIINNAAFLMTVGGTNPASKMQVAFGIGWDKSEKLWYRANTKYFLKNTDFGQAAAAVLTAAEDLAFDANERNIVECAFKAVGILEGSCAAVVDPAPAPVIPKPPPQPEPDDGGELEEDADGGAERLPAGRSNSTPLVTSSSGCHAGGAGRGSESSFALGLASVLLLWRRVRRSSSVRRSGA